MNIVLTDLFGVVIVLGTLVFVHELGHYLAAKFFKVRVEVFSLGFGKRLVGFRRGETDYRVSALPLGGYVKMSGENPMEEHTGDPGEFMSHPRWQRFIIALAGPLMNGILCVAVLTGVNMVHFEDYPFMRQPAVIGYVEQNSAAAKAGLQPGDRIVNVGSAQDPTWEQALGQIVLASGQPVHMKVQRGGEDVNVELPPTTPGAPGGEKLGFLPDQPYLITRLEPGFPAEKAGIKIGDEILAVDNIPVRSTPALSEYLQNHGGNAVTLKVSRDGAIKQFQVTPKLTKDDNGKSRYAVGLLSEGVKIEQLPLGEAFTQAMAESKSDSYLIIELLQRLVRHKASIKSLSSIVGISQIAGQATREGVIPVLQVMAALSLNLGILNLLPIPILDGGLILLLLIEGIMRRDIKREVKEMVYQAAFVLIVIFTVVVIYNDIAKILAK